MNTITTVLISAGNAALIYFALTAWFELHRLKRDITGIKRALTVTTTITMGQNVRANFKELNNMRNTLHRLIENEQYEEAEKLKDAIIRMEHNAEEALNNFKDICGDDICDVIVTKVNNRANEED